jgi:uracil phosphoribosyltransferase
MPKFVGLIGAPEGIAAIQRIHEEIKNVRSVYFLEKGR